MRLSRNNRAPSAAAFTLVEVLVAMAVFTSIVLPFFLWIGRTTTVRRAQTVLTATCLLEQESVRLRSAGTAGLVPVKVRQLNGRDWRIRSVAHGSGLVEFSIGVECDGIRAGEVRFYVNE